MAPYDGKDPSDVDPRQPLRLTYGNTAGTRARGRRARRVFHGTLTAELEDRGAATVDELYLRFDCFLLPLERNEIRQVLESARREGLVAEASDQHDGYGEEVLGQWVVTEKGRRLGRPRAMALPDLGYLVIGEHDRAVKTFDTVKTAVTVSVPALALFGLHKLDPGALTKWAAFAGVGALIAWIVAYGLRGELDLRAAAASWPRLEETRPERWEYQRSWPCMAFLPVTIALVYAAVGLRLGFGFFPWWLYAIVAISLLAFYLVEVSPLYRAWHRMDPTRCREEWKQRGDDAIAEIEQATAVD